MCLPWPKPVSDKWVAPASFVTPDLDEQMSLLKFIIDTYVSAITLIEQTKYK